MLPRRRKREKTKPYEGPWRCPSYLQFVRGFQCAVRDCDLVARGFAQRIEAAHVRAGTDGGIGLKPSDFWTIPLCDHHHRDQHLVGEQSFEDCFHLDMKALALELFETWKRTTPAGQRYRRQHEKESS